VRLRILPDSRYSGPLADSIQLLILQPTPFCNIQCDYCYLPDRDATYRMDRATYQDVLRQIFSTGLAGDELSVVWHAGEPLALPPRYYRDLFDAAEALDISRSRLRHSMQTNATLIDEERCDFILAENIHIGVSIDGPAVLNDRHRKDRQGRGTHDRTVRGMQLLRARGIDFHAIAVVTADALDHADAIFDFFQEAGVRKLGFNVEELEGQNRSSSLTQRSLEPRIRGFWERLYERQEASGGQVRIREFDNALEAIVNGRSGMTADDAMRRFSQVAPLAIVSTDWRGNFGSFSPELLGLKSLRYGNFVLGNIRDGLAGDIRENPKFARMATDIYEGVKRCERTCGYFGLCGGGAPSNKYFENGSFDSTETMFCRTSIQMPIDIVLGSMEKRLGLSPPRAAAR
jgi:uncharacterized protein